MPNNKKSTKSSTTVADDAFHEVVNLLEKRVVKQSSGCWYSMLKPNGRGHVQIKVNGIKYLGHRIMACKKYNKYIEYDVETKLEASHLCGVPRCINPDHLHLENPLVNQTRDCCRMFKTEPRYRCPHEPVCFGAISIHQV
jgi:hypothetical protein